MEAENNSRFSLRAWRAQAIVLAQAAFDAGMLYLQQNARVILAILLVAFVVLSLFSCLIIGGVGTGALGPQGGTPQPRVLSSDEATATFGAEQFYLQLTASAEQVP